MRLRYTSGFGNRVNFAPVLSSGRHIVGPKYTVHHSQPSLYTMPDDGWVCRLDVNICLVAQVSGQSVTVRRIIGASVLYFLALGGQNGNSG
jgi:hypothetical protein